MKEKQDLNRLLARCVLRDMDAFERLYRLTSAQLFALVLRIVVRRDWAEDILQESFVSIWQNAGKYQADKGNAMTWMMTITRNRAIDWVRRHPHREQSGTDLPETEPTSPGALTDYQSFEDRQRLHDCLQVLQEDQRTAILKSYFHGLTHLELAEMMAKPLGTIKSWIRRGLAQLQRCLSP